MSRNAIALRRLIYAAVATTPLVLSAATLAPTSIQEIARRAELIAELQVTNIEPRASDASGSINTYVTMRVLGDAWKGKVAGNTIELRFAGGRLGARQVVVPGVVVPRMDEHGIYFITSPEKHFVNPLQGWNGGRFIVKQVGGTGPLRVFSSNNRPIVKLDFSVGPSSQSTEPSPSIAAGVFAGTNEAEAMSVPEFKRLVQAFLQTPAGRRAQ